MKLLNIVSFVLASVSVAIAAPAVDPAMEDRYIIKLKSVTDGERFSLDDHYAWVERQLSSVSGRLPYSPRILHKYDIGSFSGFIGYSLKAPSSVIDAVRENPIVEYVVRDQIATAFGEQASPPSWGLTRTSQKKLDLTKPYYFNSDGSNVTVYIIDTGITVGHPEFGTRATLGASFVSSLFDNEDESELLSDGNGHGTHCSGTIGGSSYGIAKNAKLVGVKVLSASGSGSYAGVIAGIDWVAKTATPGASVASMSLGGGASKPVDDAVNAAVAKNIPFAIAAGNSYGQNACNVSPAGAASAFTVAASDKTDGFAYFSNAGPCVKIIAPGVDISSAWLNNGYNTISGTSMATPHVAGVMALMLSEKSYPNAQAVYQTLIDMSTPNAIRGVPANTVNRLLHNGAGLAQEE